MKYFYRILILLGSLSSIFILICQKHLISQRILISFIYKEKFELAQQLPQALIIGAAKCGTSALIEFLSVHPQVAVSHREIDYFANDKNYFKNISWYLSQMPYSNPYQITIEKTPAYLVDSNAPLRVYKFNPKIKLVVIVRDPVVRAVSHYVHAKLWRQMPLLNSMLGRNFTDEEMFKASFLN